jgi:hypothetical protein
LTSRSDLDTPAAAIAAIVGVAIILVALPFTIAAFPQTPKTYTATWGERVLDSKTLTVPTETNSYRVSVAASDFQPASIKVETTGCTDVFNGQLQQQAAKMHVKLTETRGTANKVLQDLDNVSCPGPSFTVQLGDHAKIGGADANNPETAKRIVWLDAMASNTTGLSMYTLEVTPSRAASSLPLPGAIAPTSFTASLRLTLNGWDVVMNEKQKEVGR